jgi:hypothetical protein
VLFVGSGAREKPSAELLQVLESTTLLRTDERGSVQVMVDGEMGRKKTEKE